ncbi:MAG: PilZ domain-containing protein [Candidatus Sumerlaeia bacterium]|nr:PilZ domain-containing protein [Candidatus Sumerlaeia bacterium]
MPVQLERRRASRHLEALDVEFAWYRGPSATPATFEAASALDISRSGIRLHLPTGAVELQRLIQLCIRLPLEPGPVLMVGKVRWCKPRQAGADVGVQFIGHLPPRLEEIIAELNKGREPRDVNFTPLPE